MSTVSYTIGPPTTGGAVDSYTIHQTTDGVTTDIPNADFQGTLTVAAGKTTTVSVTAINAGGSTTSPVQSVTAPAAVVASGRPTLTSSNPTFGVAKFGQGLTNGSVASAQVTLSTTSDWTIEGWVEFTGNGNSGNGGALIGTRNAANTENTGIFYVGDDRMYMMCGGLHDGRIASINDGKPHFLTMQCKAGTVAGWLDGVSIGGTRDGTGSGLAANPTFTLAAAAAGYLDDVRISNAARYTAGTNFTPPAAAMTADSTTVALWHLDGDGISM